MAVLSQHIPNALLNLEQFETDIKQGVVEKRIREDRQSGIRSGVNGTPTFLSMEGASTARRIIICCWRL
jgi:protein-disulfide isomerase